MLGLFYSHICSGKFQPPFAIVQPGGGSHLDVALNFIFVFKAPCLTALNHTVHFRRIDEAIHCGRNTAHPYGDNR